MRSLERNLNALLAIILAGVLLAGYGVQFFKHEQPCPLCLMQRLGMLGVALGALLNVKFGIRTSHYGLSILSAVFGGFVALRQIFLHVCPDFSTFGTPFWGLSLYTWSFIVFACSATYIALLLFIFDKRVPEESKPLNWGAFLAFSLIFLIAFANIITTFMQCKLGACD